MNLPTKYQFLETIGPLPKMLAIGLQYLGIKEVPGVHNNPIIMDMAKGLGVQNIYTNDDMSWCALFINNLIRMSGKPKVDDKGDKYNLLRARHLLNWGQAVTKGDEMLGDIVVITRPGGGHVGIIVAESGNTFHIFGGNQSNSVSFIEISKDRVLGVRRYYALAPPASVKKYYLDSSGQMSTNEA